MARMVGTVVRGVRAPIINKGDSFVEIVVDSIQRHLNVKVFLYRTGM